MFVNGKLLNKDLISWDESVLDEKAKDVLLLFNL